MLGLWFKVGNKVKGSARVEFIANKDGIERLVKQGHTLKQIHQTLALNMSVRQFQRIVKAQLSATSVQERQETKRYSTHPSQQTDDKPSTNSVMAETGKFTSVSAEQLEQSGLGWGSEPSGLEDGNE